MNPFTKLLSTLLALHVRGLFAFSPDPHWLNPDGSQSDLTTTYHDTDFITLSWLGLNASINDLWLTTRDTGTNYGMRIASNINITNSGTFPWTIDVSEEQLKITNEYVLRFIPVGTTYQQSFQFVQVPSPGFIIAAKAGAGGASQSPSGSSSQSTGTASSTQGSSTATSTSAIAAGSDTATTTVTAPQSSASGTSATAALSTVTSGTTSRAISGTTSSISSGASSSSTSVDSAAATSQPPPSKNDGSLSTGVKVGAAVAAIAAVAIIIGLLLWVIRLHRRMLAANNQRSQGVVPNRSSLIKHALSPEPDMEMTPSEKHIPGTHEIVGDKRQPAELSTEKARKSVYEMAG